MREVIWDFLFGLFIALALFNAAYLFVEWF